jgi:DNA-directed RNA polymerase specialized sigma24 family protein
VSSVIEIAAVAERAEGEVDSELPLGEGSAEEQPSPEDLLEDLPVQEVVQQTWHERQAAAEDRERERRTYHGRTVAMLRRYMRYSIETGRLPSLLGREFFRAKVTSYTVVTFEDRVIFVHDMEKCLARLDEFSRQLIARHILQEHDQEATGKLLGCTERTVRTYVPVVLDLLSEILVEVGLMEPLGSRRTNCCQEGEDD